MSKPDLPFDEVLARLEEVARQARQPELDLDQSLALLEEGVRLANICTQMTDHTLWPDVAEEEGSEKLPGQLPASG